MNDANRRSVRPDEPLLYLPIALSEGSAAAAVDHAMVSGQRSLVASDTLPRNIQDSYDARRDGKAALEASGVVFEGPVPDDRLFQFVRLPEGWRKVGTNHAMWSNLVDDRGRVRGRIFFKAVFYDRKAHMSVSCRFSAEIRYSSNAFETEVFTDVKDGGETVIHTVRVEVGTRHVYDARDEARTLAVAWLDANRPDWRDPAAYWNED